MTSIGGDGPIGLIDPQGGTVYSSSMYFSAFFTDFASGARDSNVQGNPLNGYIDIRHWAAGFWDVYSGAVVGGL